MFTKAKTQVEIDYMRESGQILSHVLKKLSSIIAPEMSTKDLAIIAKDELKGTGGTPTFLGYFGFPDVICISINEEVVHGIPREDKIIKSGDIVSLDFGVTYNGMITDSAVTLIVGKPISKKHVKLVHDTKLSLDRAIEVIHDGVKVGTISETIENVLNRGKYGIVRDLVGHGVGHELHEDPNIPNYGKINTGPSLSVNQTIAVEPMATLGGYHVKELPDKWTISTLDGSVAAHFEHTILITPDGAEVLTK